MDLPHAEDSLSDDDFYFGQLTLKEIKKHILWDKTRLNVACSHKTSEQDNYKSFKLIESHSEPNLVYTRNTPGLSSSKSSSSDIRTSDDTFIKLENMVEELSKSPNKAECNVELNNTLDVIDYILNHGPPEDKANLKNRELKIEDESYTSNKDVLQNKQVKVEDKSNTSVNYLLPLKEIENIDQRIYSYNYLTPAKTDNQQYGFVTPSSEIKSKIKLFKTPGPPSSEMKPSCTPMKTPSSRSKAYEHISSPVASYIKKTPQVPLMKDVHPKKPLPSSIPKYLWKSTQKKTCDKSNTNLPSIAYRSAKETQVIDIPDEEKLPKCQWAKKITSTLPKPVVMKHDHREVNFTKKPLIPNQEDSFADLSYHQADLSVCTQKSAFNFKKHL